MHVYIRRSSTNRFVFYSGHFGLKSFVILTTLQPTNILKTNSKGSFFLPVLHFTRQCFDIMEWNKKMSIVNQSVMETARGEDVTYFAAMFCFPQSSSHLNIDIQSQGISILKALLDTSSALIWYMCLPSKPSQCCFNLSLIVYKYI